MNEIREDGQQESFLELINGCNNANNEVES